MQIGKLSEPALKRSVLRQLHMEDPNGAPEYGADCSEESSGSMEWKKISGNRSGNALGNTSGNASANTAANASDKSSEDVRTVYTAVNTVPGFEHDPGKLIVAAANNLEAGGAWPSAFLVSAVLPAEYEEAQLREDMKRMAQAAHETAVFSENGTAGRIIGGHTQISDAVLRPVYSITGIGRAREHEYRARVLLKPGDDLVVTGTIGIGGTAALALAHEKELCSRYPVTMIDRAKQFEHRMSVGVVARAITHFGTTAVHDLSQGGVFNALWEMADRAGVGLEVDLKKIPVKQETIEICEYFDCNPYYLYSAGALLAGTPHGEALVAYLASCGFDATVIGRVTDGKDRVIRNGEECRYLDRPKPDEWYRI